MELTFFYLKACPYCAQAFEMLDQLRREFPEFDRIPICMIEESDSPEIASRYDYWLVPAFFAGRQKLHEGALQKEKLRRILTEALPDDNPS